MSHNFPQSVAALSILCAAILITPAGALAADDDAEPAALPTAMADFNRDGLPDLAKVTLPTTGDNGLLTVSLGQPDGSFRQLASSARIGRAPRTMVARDFNGDGIPDLLVGDADGSLTEFLGDGLGNLSFAGSVARFDSVSSLAVGDFNRDGIPDLAVSDPVKGSVTILLGQGKGQFHAIWTTFVTGLGKITRVSTADFNGDTVSDLVVTGSDDDQFVVLLGNGNGTLTEAPQLSNVRDPNSHCAT